MSTTSNFSSKTFPSSMNSGTRHSTSSSSWSNPPKLGHSLGVDHQVERTQNSRKIRCAETEMDFLVGAHGCGGHIFVLCEYSEQLLRSAVFQDVFVKRVQVLQQLIPNRETYCNTFPIYFVPEFRKSSLFSTENLDFWLDVQRFHHDIELDPNQEKITKTAEEIYSKYFKLGAANELNISSEARIK